MRKIYRSRKGNFFLAKKSLAEGEIVTEKPVDAIYSRFVSRAKDPNALRLAQRNRLTSGGRYNESTFLFNSEKNCPYITRDRSTGGRYTQMAKTSLLASGVAQILGEKYGPLPWIINERKFDLSGAGFDYDN
jgi:hypothetical protein